MPRPITDEHLGDGCYASFDGFQIWLAANDHRNKVVALEPTVFRALMDYARNVDQTYGVHRFTD